MTTGDPGRSWHEVHDYLRTHESVMRQKLREGFVCEDGQEQRWRDRHRLQIVGPIGCLGGIVIEVDKLLATRTSGGRTEVLTISYSYNAKIQGRGNILRYDNAHKHDESWADEQHKHLFDWRVADGKEIDGSPIWVPSRPTVGQVIDELQEWYWENRDDLPRPDDCADLRTRD